MLISDEKMKKLEDGFVNLAIIAMEEQQNRYDLLKKENASCYERINELENAIVHLLQCLNPSDFSDHKEDTIKMLKLLGLDSENIKLYLQGEIVL